VADPGPDGTAAAKAPSTMNRPGRFGEFAPTAVFVLYGLACAQPGAAFMLPLALPFVLIWLARMAWLAWRRPARRRAQAIKLAVVAGVLVVVLGSHMSHQRQARSAAQRVVDVLVAYRAQHGRYPDDLAQAGLDADALRTQWRIRYFSQEGDHRVMYAATFTVFDSWGYELEHPAWTFHAD
jgi:hypothetical protein